MYVLPTCGAHCSARHASAPPHHLLPVQVALDAVQYARSGAFSVNLWFKPGNMSGTSLSYLFSHRGTTNSSNATSNTGWGPNQVQVGASQQMDAAGVRSWSCCLPWMGGHMRGAMRGPTRSGRVWRWGR